jgi:hypothetical protein
MNKIDLVEEDLWDHYSGLPNPTWYEYKNQLEDEEDDTNDSINTTVSIKQDKTKAKKHLGSIKNKL